MGAIAGIAAGGANFKSAAIGAAAGAGLGAMVGNSRDKQAAALRESIGDDRITINREGDLLVVSMPQDILFEVDGTDVDPALYDELAALAENLNQYPDTRAEIVGHTDNTGDAAYNQELSVKRAQSVTGIVAANGVQAGRLTAVGQGEDAPIDSNLTEEGRARNRRVDIIIRSTGT